MDTRDGRYGCTCPGCLMDTVRTVQDMPDQYAKGYAQAIKDAAKVCAQHFDYKCTCQKEEDCKWAISRAINTLLSKGAAK